jgi:diguanylate cyclase (GGDEF)-like protein/PAS domain S-box-containing protein
MIASRTQIPQRGTDDDPAVEFSLTDDERGYEVALLDSVGVITSVNSAWSAFGEANGGEGTRCGPGVSYLDICAAAGGDSAAGQVAAAIHIALAGELPAPRTIDIPCHSPETARWFDVLVASRFDVYGECIGASVTLSARTGPRLTIAPQKALVRLGKPVAVPVEEHHGRLLALQQASAFAAATASAELNLPAVLRAVVDSARDLLGARYAALGVLGYDGRLEEFVHSGMDEATVERIGNLPRGHGVLGQLISHPVPMRLADLGSHPASVGFPAEHPPMGAFLGIPIVVGGEVFGDLYLTEPVTGGEFSARDQDLATVLAATAASAIANARRLGESEQRRRWLAASAELTFRLLGADTAPLQVITNAAAAAAEADVVTLTVLSGADTIVERAASGPLAAALTAGPRLSAGTVTDRVIRSGMPLIVRIDDLTPEMVGLGIGAVMVVPLAAGDTVHAALTIARRDGRPSFSAAELDMASVFASQATLALELFDTRAAQLQLAALEGKNLIASDLHDHVIQELFATGMDLQRLAGKLERRADLDRLHAATESLDNVINRIRTTISALAPGPSAQLAEPTSEGLDVALLAVIEQAARQLDCTPTVRFSGPLDAVTDPALVDDLVAVTRELLSNCARHAVATSVCFSVAVTDELVRVVIADNGVGMGKSTRSSGLTNLRRRAERHGGTLEISSSETQGSCLDWTARLASQDEADRTVWEMPSDARGESAVRTTLDAQPEEVAAISPAAGLDLGPIAALQRALAAEEAKWRAAFDDAPVGMLQVDDSGRIIAANQALAQLAESTVDDLRGSRLADRLPAKGSATSETLGRGPQLFLTTAGNRRWVSVHAGRLEQTDVIPARTLIHLTDVTLGHEDRQQLEAAHARFSALVEHSSDATVVTTGEGVVFYASPAVTTVTGLAVESLIGTNVKEQCHPDDLLRVTAFLTNLTPLAGKTATFHCRVRHTGGTWRHVEITATNWLHDPAIAGIVANARDITEKVEAAGRLSHQAMHDTLTHLPNRALMLDRLNQALARATRPGRSCAVLFLDLDRFKDINDTLGHAAGDILLTTVAERLSRTIRPGDSVARLGGDEFIVLAENVDAATTLEIAERLRAAVAQPVDLDGRPVVVTTSVGIALADEQSPTALLQEADMALYQSKRSGRNRWEIYDQAMRLQAQRRFDIEALIRTAIDGAGPELHYQPIIDLDSGTVLGYEALARLADSSGLIPPDEFIAIAEDSGLIVDLGARILTQACAQQSRDNQATGLARHVAVNVSARQLASVDFLAHVTGALATSGLPAALLSLELTETALIDGGTSTCKQLDDIKNLGVSLAIDDFGTGWASLAYLRRFPVDAVKIDRSFLAGLGTNRDDTELVKAVISLAHALELTSVAEGVETEVQHELLRRLGCHRAQGYLYGRPEPADPARSASSAT